MENFKKISDVLESDSSDEKIRVLEELIDVTDLDIIQKIILRLDDPDIRVRGEAFSSLVLNENKISQILINNLKSDNKNIRGYVALVLANRKEYDAISSIINLTKDERSMVRSCAVGALGYLNAKEAAQAVQDCLLDSNMEVKKSALQAAINLGNTISKEKIKEIAKDADEELMKILVQIDSSGPGGI